MRVSRIISFLLAGLGIVIVFGESQSAAQMRTERLDAASPGLRTGSRSLRAVHRGFQASRITNCQDIRKVEKRHEVGPVRSGEMIIIRASEPTALEVRTWREKGAIPYCKIALGNDREFNETELSEKVSRCLGKGFAGAVLPSWEDFPLEMEPETQTRLLNRATERLRQAGLVVAPDDSLGCAGEFSSDDDEWNSYGFLAVPQAAQSGPVMPEAPAPVLVEPPAAPAKPVSAVVARPAKPVVPRPVAPVPAKPTEPDDRQKAAASPSTVSAIQKPVTPPKASRPQLPTMKIQSQRIQLRLGPGVWWDGCGQALVQGGRGKGSEKRDAKCDRERLHPNFARHMEKHFYACAVEGARKAGLSEPAKVFVNYDASYVVRPIRGSSRWSEHAFARALDIYSISVTDQNGHRTWIDMNVKNYRKPYNAKFYNGFRACWKRTFKSRRCKGSIGIPHSELGGNSAHLDHLHLELPARCE